MPVDGKGQCTVFTEENVLYIYNDGEAFAILFAFHIIHSNVQLLIKIRGNYETNAGRNGPCGGNVDIITIDEILKPVSQSKNPVILTITFYFVSADRITWPPTVVL
jgi:hypothetical protein